MNFLNVLINNIKCTLCRNKKCHMRYQPNREKIYFYEGTRYRKTCPKVRKKREDKRWKKIMKK